MMIDTPCNIYSPTGATPMTIADAILRECDQETLEDVLYYIDCYLKKHGVINKERDDKMCNNCIHMLEMDEMCQACKNSKRKGSDE